MIVLSIYGKGPLAYAPSTVLAHPESTLRHSLLPEGAGKGTPARPHALDAPWSHGGPSGSDLEDVGVCGAWGMRPRHHHGVRLMLAHGAGTGKQGGALCWLQHHVSVY